jgi:CRISPR/Cas system endoribonuclease Cas6 (RAMP superfamily)
MIQLNMSPTIPLEVENPEKKRKKEKKRDTKIVMKVEARKVKKKIQHGTPCRGFLGSALRRLRGLTRNADNILTLLKCCAWYPGHQ